MAIAHHRSHPAFSANVQLVLTVAAWAVSVEREVAARRRWLQLRLRNWPRAFATCVQSWALWVVGLVSAGWRLAVNQTKAASVRTGNRGKLFGVGSVS